jgi:hypothetical protein
MEISDIAGEGERADREQGSGRREKEGGARRSEKP